MCHEARSELTKPVTPVIWRLMVGASKMTQSAVVVPKILGNAIKI